MHKAIPALLLALWHSVNAAPYFYPFYPTSMATMSGIPTYHPTMYSSLMDPHDDDLLTHPMFADLKDEVEEEELERARRRKKAKAKRRKKKKKVEEEVEEDDTMQNQVHEAMKQLSAGTTGKGGNKFLVVGVVNDGDSKVQLQEDSGTGSAATEIRTNVPNKGGKDSNVEGSSGSRSPLEAGGVMDVPKEDAKSGGSSDAPKPLDSGKPAGGITAEAGGASDVPKPTQEGSTPPTPATQPMEDLSKASGDAKAPSTDAKAPTESGNTAEAPKMPTESGSAAETPKPPTEAGNATETPKSPTESSPAEAPKSPTESNEPKPPTSDPSKPQ